MREVVIKSSAQKDLIKHESAAQTFGELKKEMKQIKWSGMRVVERSSKATLQMDDAILPQGDFLLFLVPEKVKSGKKTSGGTEKLSKNIEECNYNECRSHISWLNKNKDANLDMSGGTDDLRLQLMEYYDKGSSKPAAKAAKKPAAKTPKAKAEKVAEWKETPREDDEDDEDYADRLAFEKKAFDKKRKKAAEKAEELRLAAEKAEKEKAEKEAAEKKAAEETPKKKKKGFFAKKEKTPPVPTDPIEIIEASRDQINKAVDDIVEEVISGGGSMAEASAAVLRYTEKGLDEELKKIRRALRTSRSNASYIE